MKMKFRTFYDIKDSDIGSCNAGDGKAVKQYHLDEKLHKIVPTIDEKTGERITHNLYQDIQNNLDYTNYKKLLEINGLPPLEDNYTGEVVDYSNIGSYGEILKANNKIYKQTGKTPTDLFKDLLEKNKNKLDNNDYKVENKSSQSQVVTEDKSSK